MAGHGVEIKKAVSDCVEWQRRKGCKGAGFVYQKIRQGKVLHVHDKLNEVYDFKKAQELLVTDAKTGLKILENENDGGENHAEHRTSDKGLR